MYASLNVGRYHESVLGADLQSCDHYGRCQALALDSAIGLAVGTAAMATMSLFYSPTMAVKLSLENGMEWSESGVQQWVS